MRIVYCMDGTYNAGGMERIITSKANYFAGIAGYEVIIITTEQKQRLPFFPLDSSIRQFDLNINYGDDKHQPIWKKYFSHNRKKKLHQKRLSVLLMELNADIVISAFGNEMEFLFKIKDGSKKILEIHFSRFFRLQNIRKGLWRLVDIYRSRRDLVYVKKFDRFIVLTEEDKKNWKNQNNLVVIPNYNLSKSETKARLINKKALMAGRLSYQKGYERVISIWFELNKKFPDWSLDIFGKGELLHDLQQLIDQSGLTDKIRINEPVKDIEQIYLESSIFLLTSHYEGFPMVLTEAMAHGIPVVAYDCPCGPKDMIIDGENGFLINDGDKEGFIKKVLLLMENEELRKKMGEKAKISMERFSEESVMQKWITLFHDLMGIN